MAAPTPTTRATPSGIMLDDGFSTKITFASDANIEFWERTVTPPGVDGGDAIDQTTMHATAWRVQRARQLKTLTEGSSTVGYDPGVLTAIIALVNVETTITYTFPDGSTWAFYGYLRTFTPNEMSEGAVPEATITIQPTNFDLVNKTEEGPAIASIAGT
jgi:hypothetical protein